MDREGRFVCKCECGGDVLGVPQFGRLWTWCTKCTPVVQVQIPAKLNRAEGSKAT